MVIDKSEILKQEKLNKSEKAKTLKKRNRYNLEDRTKKFSKDIRMFFKNQKIKFYTIDDIKQLTRASGSIGANYIEANESFSKKDFVYRIRIAKKEAKECSYWIEILMDEYEGLEKLLQESMEIMFILGSIYQKSV